MAQARQADRAYPQAAMYPVFAVAAALLVTAIIAFSALGVLRIQLPTIGGVHTNQAVLDSGADWELQRRAQGGYVDPVIQSGNDWERERRQQGGASE